jgi:hypothetical protein
LKGLVHYMANTGNTGNLSPEILNAMLKMAGQKLGMTTEQLRATISDPKKADELLSSLNKNSGGKAKEAMGSTSAIEDLLKSNPKAKKMLENLMGGKK